MNEIENKNNDSFLLFKIVIIGNSSVGKTRILNSYALKEYTFKNDTKSTIGINFVSVRVKIKGDFVNFQIWDTAGEERYRSIIMNYFKKAKGALIVYDITNDKSFNQIDFWFKELKNQTDAEIILVGNKLDLSEERKIDYSTGKAKAKSCNASFFELSAKIRKILMKFLILYLIKYMKIIRMKMMSHFLKKHLQLLISKFLMNRSLII